MDYPPPEPPASAFVSLADSPYGFSRVDLQIPIEEWSVFKRISIEKEQTYHRFGDLSALESEVAAFLNQAGQNAPETVRDSAALIQRIASEVLSVAGKEVAWFHLRASTPTSEFDLPRWHMDGYYYQTGDHPSLQYKFVATLLGPSTLFYPIPTASQEMRKIIWMHTNNRKFMHELCQGSSYLQLSEGEGAFFVGGDNRKAAIHSEPPIHENRLFFSIIPCSPEELPELQKRIIFTYNRPTGS